MKKINFKKILPHLVAILVFLVLSLTYFSPVVLDHKDLRQGDVVSSKGWGHDLKEYHDKTGKYAYWSNAMFSGMPCNYTYMPHSTNIFVGIGKVLSLNNGRTFGLLFLYMLGFYIFLISLGVNPWLSIVGSIAYGFTSYNIIIIEAGHINKGLVMATMAPIIGGIILTFRKKYLAGIFLTLIFAGLNVYWNHQQISYYLLLTVIILAIVYFIYAIKQHWLKDFFKSSAILIVVAFLSILPSIGFLWPNMDYTKDSMRGGAVLKTDKSGQKESKGLDIDYAYQWSYGIGETMTLLIPDFYGGSSTYDIGRDSKTYRALSNTGQAYQFTKQAPMYWGDKPFTSGPVYAGALICLLFILGLIIVKGPEKWWILGATVLSFILAWGKNFPGVNDFLFYHLPLYNKFRTPEMALVIANVTMVTLAVLAVKTVIATEDKRSLLKPLYIALGITGGLSLIFALFGGSLFSFDAAVDKNFPAWLQGALIQDRKHLLTSDAWRSLLFILLGSGVLLVYINKKIKVNYLISILGVLILIDLWNVDKRFLNNDSFVEKRNANVIQPTQIDQLIMQDKDPDYRVLNLAANTFNESMTSYFHKSIGGYSPAKLRRYQDIIDYYLSDSINPSILNMLNARYIIFPTKQGNRVQQNPDAFGNAWFVDNIKWVNSPDREIESLKNINSKYTAVVDKSWEKKIPNASLLASNDTTATIKLTNYANPGNLFYESNSSSPRLAVFSEVYYKTWKAYIDGKEAPLARVDYILRGMEVPAGKHQIELRCVDNIIIKSAKISLISSIAVGVVLLALFGFLIYQGYKSFPEDVPAVAETPRKAVINKKAKK